MSYLTQANRCNRNGTHTRKVRMSHICEVVSVLIKPYFRSNADHLAEARLQQQ